VSRFITGAAGTGKTAALIEEATLAAQRGAILLTSPSWASLRGLREGVRHERAIVRALHEIALETLAGAELVEDVRAAYLFEEAAQPLLRLEWTEFIEAEVDPEVPGLHAPARFLDAAFRLFCKLRDARIGPDDFLKSALQGATQFYAKPPNFASPELLYYTKDSYRDSLAADGEELQRQYRREVDLAKILAKLYRSYLDHPVRQGCLTARDAIAEAARLLENDPDACARMRDRYPVAFVDDAQELTIGELQFLQALYGPNLDDVTIAGDPDSATSTFRGARPDRVFAIEGERVVLTGQRRSPYAVDIACAHLSGAPRSSTISTDPEIGLRLFRATTRRAEAQFIAEHTIDLLNKGARHSDVALIFRSVQKVRPYVDALLERNVRVQVGGDLNVFSEPEALDALAVLWSLYDPFRHEYLLRMLAGPAMALSDAAVQVLCAEPPDAQTLLFSPDDGAQAEARSGRWDPKRDLRLGWNVVRGDCDSQLDEVERLRIQAFRRKREAWLEALRSHSLPALVRRVWSEGLAQRGTPGSAQAAYQQQTLRRLFDRIVTFAEQHENATLGDFLEDAHRRMETPFEAHEADDTGADAVRILSIDAARGREFDHVIIPSARAGSFPRWYVPDAFLYSPSLGMIAKENVGDARAARTAKFSYYMFRTKAREAYNREERRAFVYAMRRAGKTVLVTASERATRGIAAPEFLAELQAAQIPGTIDASDRWRPAKTVYGS
jgi:superfamily I DNA/RNA helicase